MITLVQLERVSGARSSWSWPSTNLIFLFWCGDSSMQFVAELSTLETCWHCSSDNLLYVRTPSWHWLVRCGLTLAETSLRGSGYAWQGFDRLGCSSTRIWAELKSRRSTSGTLVGGVDNYFTNLAVPPTLHTRKWSGVTSITHSYTLECRLGLKE